MTRSDDRLRTLGIPGPGPKLVRFDPEKLYVAIDARRRQLRISRREVLRQVGEHTPSSLTRLGQGTHPSADLLVRMLVWLGETDLTPFISAREDKEGGGQ